jgi:hypothetical protein
MMIIFLSLAAALGQLEETTIIWDSEGIIPSREQLPEMIRDLDFGIERKLSFIRLLFSDRYTLFSPVDGRCLTIDMVQRGRAWDLHGSFCNPILYSWILEYLESRNLSVEDIQGIIVTNAANPRIAGCRCYVRTLVSLGFSIINGEIFHSEDDLNNFCTKNSEPDETLEYVARRGPPAPSEAFAKIRVPENIKDILAPAFVYTREVAF